MTEKKITEQAEGAQGELDSLEAILDDVCGKDGCLPCDMPIYNISLNEIAEAFTRWQARAALAERTPEPKKAEGAQGEREAFEAAAAKLGIYTCNFVRYDEDTARCQNARVCDPVHVGDYRSSVLQDCWKVWQEARAALAQPSQTGEYGDAYQGAREDLAIWKRRALEAEQALREERILTERLGNMLNDENGPTFMGEPNVAQPSIFPAYDPNRCLVCGENHGSSNLPCPKMRTTSAVNPKAQLSPAPELERPESSDDWASALLDVAVLREALTSSDSSERLKNMDAGEVMRRAFGKLKEIRAQHQRIDAARVAEIERLKAEITDQALIAASEARRALAAENQRDAALSRLAEIERQDPVAHANPSDLENDGFTHTFHARSESWEGSVPLYAHPVAQAGQVPKEAGESDAPRMSADTEPEIAWRDGFNACRDRWLAAAPQPETVKNHEHPTDD